MGQYLCQAKNPMSWTTTQAIKPILRWGRCQVPCKFAKATRLVSEDFAGACDRTVVLKASGQRAS